MIRRRILRSAAACAMALTVFGAGQLGAQTPGTVVGNMKITEDQGLFSGQLEKEDRFGSSIALLGDINNDGRPDVAIGATGDDDGGADRGSVWVLRLSNFGTVTGAAEVNDILGGFSGVLDNSDQFGYSLAGIGDLDGDGTPDLAVGARGDDDGGSGRGAVWVLYLFPTGTVKAHAKISSSQGGFTGVLDNFDSFGSSIAATGDLDGDGVPDMVVGAEGDDDGGSARGALWVLYMNANGTVKGHKKISSTQGGFGGSLINSDAFGSSVTAPGDVDGDGVSDLVVGAKFDDDGGSSAGALWVLLMNGDETVRHAQKISATSGDFTGALGASDNFAQSLTAMGDLDGDNVPDIATGAPGDDDGGSGKGAVWLLFLKANGEVKGHRKYSETQGGFTPPLQDGDRFGFSVASLGDMNGNGVVDLMVGADLDDDCNDNYGATHTMMLDTTLDPWDQLQVPGTLGISDRPTLTGLGSLQGNTPMGLDLGNAPAGAIMLARIAFFPTPANVLGGTLYAHPFVFQVILFADGNGEFAFTGNWDPAPSGVDIWFQFLVQDSSNLYGVTLSNCIKGTTP